MADNERAGRKLYDSVAGYRSTIFTLDKESTREASRQFSELKTTGRDDYITMENVIADPNGKRISSLLTMRVILETCNIKHPSVDGAALSGLENAMAVPPDFIIESPDVVLAMGDGALDQAVRSQLRFGFDPATEILKNCSASHTVIHSFLKGVLQTLYEKIKAWGSRQLETAGQEMALCKALEICDAICQVIEEAKQATCNNNRAVVAGGACGLCKGKGHGRSSIVTPFIRSVDERYKQTSQASSWHGGVPAEFLVRGGHARKRRSAASNESAVASEWAIQNVRNAAKRAKLNKSVSAIVERIAKDHAEAQPEEGSAAQDETLANIRLDMLMPGELVQPMSPEIEPEEPQPIDIALAPTSEQVEESASSSLQLESAGIPSYVEWMRKRNLVDTKAIEKYAAKGSGINTGKYRGFNNTLL